MSRFSLLFAVCLAVTALAWAAGAPVMSKFDPSQVVLSPSGEIRDRTTLDDPQPDTLRYDDGNPQIYYDGMVNYYVYVRFTPPVNFQLRSIYVAVWSPVAATCSLFVHLPGAGTNPGTLLSSTTFTLAADFIWYDVNLPDSLDFTAQQDFLIVVGRATGGAAIPPNIPPPGWHMVFDQGTTTNRSKTTNNNGNRTAGPYYAVSGDYPIRAGGVNAPLTDISAVQCFNSVQPSGGPSFNVLPGTEMRFKGEVSNAGNLVISADTVRWSVRGPGGGVVFTDQAAGGPLALHAHAFLQTPTIFSPTTLGEYLVTCVSRAAGDANAENDTTRLRFFVGDQPRWFRYDDNAAPESHVNSATNSGYGLSFTPVSYTAAIESVRVEVSATGPVTGDLRIYGNDAQGVPGGAALWQSTPSLVSGWNVVAVNPPVQIYEGESFAVAYLWTGAALGKDGSSPNDAGIDSMGTVSWQVSGSGATWNADNSGNWAIQAYLDTSDSMPPYPMIETDPNDTLQFGQVDTTGATSRTLDLVIYNRGSSDPLNVTQMAILPVTIRSVFTINPTTVTVPASDSAIVQITFNPATVRTYNGSLTITNNSVNMPAVVLTIRAEGVRANAVEILDGSLPGEFALEQNFPNPFNPATDIRFALPVASHARLTVFNVIGQEIAVLADGMHSAGVHIVTFDASQLPAGVYFYRLEAGSFSDIRKMLLLK
ncbi:MAG: T9SS type A sorting domain-containing protein [bacterium]|nr:T9SS type A sorting domain-containing protein [bacterium]